MSGGGGRVVAWGVPRRRIDVEKLVHALLLVAADLEKQAAREREGNRESA